MSQRLGAIARETVAISERGRYHSAAGHDIYIADQVTRAINGTRLYQPEDALAATVCDRTPLVEVSNESSVAAILRLGGDDLACLVFASARNPGGGFLNGAQAQEESLARSSALYPCLRAAPQFYEAHRASLELTYSDRVIYSPAVPVFRNDKAHLLDNVRLVSFLTAAAPNRSAIVRNQPEAAEDIPVTLARRAARVLDIAGAHGHRRLLLGAWGCGVFGNDPATVAAAFATALARRPWFDQVTFAVLDRQTSTATYQAFARTFADPDWQSI